MPIEVSIRVFSIEEKSISKVIHRFIRGILIRFFFLFPTQNANFHLAIKLNSLFQLTKRRRTEFRH